MTKTSAPGPAEFRSASVPAFWPMAMAAALVEEGIGLYAKNLRFVDEEIKIHEHGRPQLATKNRVRLDLRTMLLREYGEPGGIPTIVDAPHAGHTAMIADYHQGQSLIETLLANGIGHVVLTDWKSATEDNEGSRHRQLPRRTAGRGRRPRSLGGRRFDARLMVAARIA